jgi:hypothetical protein
MNENWADLTLEQRIEIITEARKNACPDDNHVYEDMVFTAGNGTMLNQVCKICFNVQGWIYNWDSRG